ncbi:conserved protein of unknown function [Magnetospirillum sp. XM-1]|uniref:DUF5343 domain-containing protein n=1 Tax=Magnetospirillum sp. XM-1 TaxID=1663591 RepID=UPI00073DC53B|nr:DUF5343 domain-containing protein [Magnetospirillum sp. XM-1]CUW37174.1 conserved protein of unknown function [Magnetospirillum sp. XM-1]
MAGESNSSTAIEENDAQGGTQSRRKIQGGLPYTLSPGVLTRVLEKLPISEKPSIFTQDFLGTVLGATGGSARPIIPILKATGLLNQSGSPTELYSQFQTEGGRAKAAELALKTGFVEIFKRNQFAHRADEKAIIDLIVAVTGLPKGDRIVRGIYTTFEAFQTYAKSAREDVGPVPQAETNSPELNSPRHEEGVQRTTPKLGLAYNINVVLPETTNVDVYNAIFKSLRSNLLQ